MEEIWKDIPNYNGYQVSNFGRVRTNNKVTHTDKNQGYLSLKIRNNKYENERYKWELL